MRHLRIIGLALAAVFAIAAFAASSAMALPEWGQCYLKGAGGKYTDSNCTKKSSTKSPGEFEWRKNTAIVNKKFKGAGGAGLLSSNYIICEPAEKVKQVKCAEGETEASTPISVECTSEENHGETKGTKEVTNVSVKFLGCTALGTNPCSNGPAPGEIVVNPLKGSLGYIKKASKEVGVLLTPAVAHGEFAKFDCASFLGIVVGQGKEVEAPAYGGKNGGNDGIISPITPVNEMTTAFTQTYSGNEAFENLPPKFEGKPIALLETYLYSIESPGNGSKWSRADQTITNVNTPEEATEIKG